MISRMRTAGLAVGDPPDLGPAERADPDLRLRALVGDHFDLVWRTLRRLGVPPSDLDDATQQVFVVAARKLVQIADGSERPFLLQSAVRIASDWRRTHRRRREVVDPVLLERTDFTPGPDELLDQRRARALLDAVLDGMPLPLRAVFELYEIVASRLRRARVAFQTEVQRLEGLRAPLGGSHE
jgi:RNA polymerase sigma-70 factor, ECF subfamily